jgi:hypothetical protein
LALEVEAKTLPEGPLPEFCDGSSTLGSKGETVFAPAIPQETKDKYAPEQPTAVAVTLIVSLGSAEEATAHHSPILRGAEPSTFLTVKLRPVPVGLLKERLQGRPLAKVIMMSFGFEVVSVTEHVTGGVAEQVFDAAPSKVNPAACTGEGTTANINVNITTSRKPNSLQPILPSHLTHIVLTYIAVGVTQLNTKAAERLHVASRRDAEVYGVS